MARPLKPTFSIEQEFIIRYNRHTYLSALEEIGPSAPSMLDDRLADTLRKHIVHELAASGHQVQLSSGTRSRSAWVIGSEPAIHHSSLFGLGDSDTSYCDVKIMSPVFRLSRKSLYEVKHIFRTLDKRFDVLTDRAFCGLNVHVGNKKGFDLHTIKKFCILITSFESHLSSLHPPERVVDNERVERQTARFSELSPFQIAMKVQPCPDLQSLVGLFPDTYLAYSIHSLLDETRPKAIEFRQYQATTDVQEIGRWINLCCALIRHSHDVVFEDLTQTVQDIACEQRNSVIDVLLGLKLAKLALHYQGRERHEYQRYDQAWLYDWKIP